MTTRARLASLLVPLVSLSVAACGAAPEAPPDGVVREEVVGGYVDDGTKGAIGLGLSIFNGAFFFGHCSGSLILPNLVLTARHCVSMTSGGGPQNSVVCGSTGFNNPAQGDWFRVTAETVRPEDDGPAFFHGTGQVVIPPSNDLCGADVALILLAENVPASVAEPIVPRIDSFPLAGEPYSAVGYGLTDPNDQGSGGTRYRFDGATVTCSGDPSPDNPYPCSSATISQIQASEWEGTAPTCPGDSGGPALDAKGRVTGVLSRGPQGCLSSVYGNVSSWKDMILDTAQQAVAQGGYDPPTWVTTGSTEPPPGGAGGAAGAGGGAGAGGAGGATGGVQGEECDASTPCAGGFVCATAEDGYACTAVCSDTTPCPSGLECSIALGACFPPASSGGPAANAEDSGSCAVGPKRPAGPVRPVPWVIGAALALGALRLRRRERHR